MQNRLSREKWSPLCRSYRILGHFVLKRIEGSGYNIYTTPIPRNMFGRHIVLLDLSIYTSVRSSVCHKFCRCYGKNKTRSMCNLISCVSIQVKYISITVSYLYKDNVWIQQSCYQAKIWFNTNGYYGNKFGIKKKKQRLENLSGIFCHATFHCSRVDFVLETLGFNFELNIKISLSSVAMVTKIKMNEISRSHNLVVTVVAV